MDSITRTDSVVKVQSNMNEDDCCDIPGFSQGRKLSPRAPATSATHTMSDSLERYLEIKVHQTVLERVWDEILVVGAYSRYSGTSIPFEGEKRDKPFNWERPTARVAGNTLYVECFPGYDHVEHYAEIIACYLNERMLTGDVLTPPSRVFFLPTSSSHTDDALEATNLPLFPGHGVDTVVLGLVWHLPLLTKPFDWQGDGPWQWIVRDFDGRKVAFLGFRPAFWGCISGQVVHYLASRFHVKNVIYLGKLGALKGTVRPNAWLATGGESLVRGRTVQWRNILAKSVQKVASDSTIFGAHVTLGSVLHETKEWHAGLVRDFDFVDPEIGMMAQAAIRNGINYGYLHMITDNLGSKYDEDLSNERIRSVVWGRERLHKAVQDVMVDFVTTKP